MADIFSCDERLVEDDDGTMDEPDTDAPREQEDAPDDAVVLAPPSTVGTDVDEAEDEVEDNEMKSSQIRNAFLVVAKVFKEKAIALVRGRDGSSTDVHARVNLQGYLTPLYKAITTMNKPVSLTSLLYTPILKDYPGTLAFIQSGNAARLANTIVDDVLTFPGIPPFVGDHVFKNGIFNHRTLTFVPFDEDYEADAYKHVSARKYYDIDFDPTWIEPGADVTVPDFERIFADQGWSADKTFLAKALLGRLGFVVHAKDGFDVTPIFYGRGGTGKTTLVDSVVRAFYAQAQVGYGSNTMNDRFGIHPLVDREVVVFNDVDSNIFRNGRLDLGTLKNMISGEEITYDRKNQSTITGHTWTSPLVFVTNSVITFDDNQDQFTRRIVYFEFDKQVSGDTRIADTLREPVNQAKIMIGTTRAYLELLEGVNGAKDMTMDKILSDKYPDLHQAKHDIQAADNPIFEFVEVMLAPHPHGEQGYMLYKQYKALYDGWAADNDVDIKLYPICLPAFKQALQRKGYSLYKGKDVRRSPYYASLSDDEKKRRYNALRTGILHGAAKNAFAPGAF